MFGALYDKIGEGWHPVMDTFADLVMWDMEYNSMPEVIITGVDEKQKSLRIYYNGGNKQTDAYASFAKALSSKICETCGRAECN